VQTVFRFLFAALLFGSGMLPAAAGQKAAPSARFPGWETEQRETGTVFFYCVSPKTCGDQSIVSLHFHDAPAPTKQSIREQHHNNRLPISCGRNAKWDYCEYPFAVDRNGKPIEFKPLGPKVKIGSADYFRGGHLAARNGSNFLVTVVSSARSDALARKNYALIVGSFAR
jgi:hypothetical protein